jgi:hypothetical protein
MASQKNGSSGGWFGSKHPALRVEWLTKTSKHEVFSVALSSAMRL